MPWPSTSPCRGRRPRLILAGPRGCCPCASTSRWSSTIATSRQSPSRRAVGAVGPDHPEPPPARQGQPGGVLRQDHPDQLPVAERRRVAHQRLAASGPRRRAPAGGPRRRPCTPPPRRTTRGARRGRAPTTRPPRRPSRRPTPAPCAHGPRATRGAPRRDGVRWRTWRARRPRPRRRSPRWRPRRRARRGGSRAAPARPPIVVRRVAARRFGSARSETPCHGW